MASSNWFSTDTQQALYQATTDRSLLIVKQAQAQRMQAEYAKVEEKYDGGAAARIEDDINALGDQKTALSQWLTSIDDGLAKFDTAREYLLQAQGTLAVATPNAEAFDTYYDALNSTLYNERFDNTSLVSNTSNHRGSWLENTTMVAANGMTAELSHHYLGSDIGIQLDDGTYLDSDVKGSLSGGGINVSRKNLELVSRDSDGKVVFRDVSDPENPVTYSGTLKRGGLGVLPAWLYGDLSDPAVKDEAKADFKTAFKKLARFELDFNVDQATLSGIDSSLTSKMQGLQDDYERVANAEADAKIAEKKAIKSRFDIYNNALALTSGNSTYLITQMFNTKVGEKQSLTDVLLGAVSS